MQVDWRMSTWKQFGAAIDMFGDAINLCPDHLWTVVVYTDPDDERYGQFWFIAYHTLRWLDLFLNGTKESFTPPSPFEVLTDERAQERCVFEWMEPSFLELQLYCMRHVQEHAAQLSLVLGQHGVTGMDWIASARIKNE